MTKLDFVKKLYNGKNCYSDHMDESELQLLHLASNAESIITDMLSHNRIVFLTGNPILVIKYKNNKCHGYTMRKSIRFADN